MFVGFQNEISNESGPPNMAGATIIAAARARDSTSWSLESLAHIDWRIVRRNYPFYQSGLSIRFINPVYQSGYSSCSLSYFASDSLHRFSSRFLTSYIKRLLAPFLRQVLPPVLERLLQQFLISRSVLEKLELCCRALINWSSRDEMLFALWRSPSARSINMAL